MDSPSEVEIEAGAEEDEVESELDEEDEEEEPPKSFSSPIDTPEYSLPRYVLPSLSFPPSHRLLGLTLLVSSLF